MPNNLQEIIEAEDVHLQKLHELIKDSLKEEQLLSSRLLEIESDQELTLGQKMADKLASFGGSWSFIIIFIMVMMAWIALNTYSLIFKPFDPYPFILLNLVLSCLAALQAPVIMMSQNRQEDKDRSRARSDYMINIKAEMEVRTLHQKIDLLIAEQMRSLFEIQRSQLEILNRIEKKIENKNL